MKHSSRKIEQHEKATNTTANYKTTEGVHAWQRWSWKVRLVFKAASEQATNMIYNYIPLLKLFFIATIII